jgi:hypothetical protein
MKRIEMKVDTLMSKVVKALVGGATALAVLSPTAAYASTFSWNWHRSGNTVAYANLSSSGGSTYVREVTGWCGPGEGADVHVRTISPGRFRSGLSADGACGT